MMFLRRGYAPLVALATFRALLPPPSSAAEASAAKERVTCTSKATATDQAVTQARRRRRACAVEVCLGDVPSVVEAVRGGADRVELCSSLGDGGTTPSLGAMAGAVDAVRGSATKVMVLVRPRAGDFCYTPAEVGRVVSQRERRHLRGILLTFMCVQ